MAYTGWWLWWTRSTSISLAVGELLDDGGITEASSRLRGAASYSQEDGGGGTVGGVAEGRQVAAVAGAKREEYLFLRVHYKQGRV